MRPPRPGAPGESCARNGDETYCVSSVLKPQFGNSYGAQNLFGGSSALAWVEGREGSGVGEWITIEFDGMRLVVRSPSATAIRRATTSSRRTIACASCA